MEVVTCPTCANTFVLSSYLIHAPSCYYDKCTQLNITPLCSCVDCRGHKTHSTHVNSSKRLAVESHYESDSNNSSTLSNLPEEILYLILSHFQENEESFFVGLVCKKWSSLVKRDQGIHLADIVEYYALHGGLSAIQLLNQYSAKTTYQVLEDYTKYISYGAAQSGNIQLLEYLTTLGCPFNSTTCKKAGQGGHLDVIKWLGNRMNNWESPDTPSKYQAWITDICAGAASGGHLHIIEWMFDKFDTNDVKSLAQHAAKNGKLHILKWLYQKGLIEDITIITRPAAENGHLDILEWALLNGSGIEDSLLNCAAQKGHLNVIKWLIDKQCPWDDRILKWATEHGHLEILEWAFQEGYSFTDKICRSAAKKGQLEVLQWIRENNLPWYDDWVKKYPFETENYLEALKWAASIGFSINRLSCSFGAGNLDVLKYLRENDCRWGYDFMYMIAQVGDADTLKWALENGFTWDEDIRNDSSFWDDLANSGNAKLAELIFKLEKPNYDIFHQIGSGAASVNLLKCVLKYASLCLDDLLESSEITRVVAEWLKKQIR